MFPPAGPGVAPALINMLNFVMVVPGGIDASSDAGMIMTPRTVVWAVVPFGARSVVDVVAVGAVIVNSACENPMKEINAEEISESSVVFIL